jgi:hypothetical protein
MNAMMLEMITLHSSKQSNKAVSFWLTSDDLDESNHDNDDDNFGDYKETDEDNYGTNKYFTPSAHGKLLQAQLDATEKYSKRCRMVR